MLNYKAGHVSLDSIQLNSLRTTCNFSTATYAYHYTFLSASKIHSVAYGTMLYSAAGIHRIFSKSKSFSNVCYLLIFKTSNILETDYDQHLH